VALIEGLKALREPCEVTIITDSQYVKKRDHAMATRVEGARMAKRRATTREVLNRDLWQELENALARHGAKWAWVKGHAGHEDNTCCDQLALKAAQMQPIPRLTMNELA
jgi:ribonuclease HI